MLYLVQTVPVFVEALPMSVTCTEHPLGILLRRTNTCECSPEDMRASTTVLLGLSLHPALGFSTVGVRSPLAAAGGGRVSCRRWVMNAAERADEDGLTRREVLKNMGIAATAAACATTGEPDGPSERRESFCLR